MQQLEAVAANVHDLQDGEMRQVSVGEMKILLTRLDGKLYAVGAHCTHYQASLAEGVLSGNHDEIIFDGDLQQREFIAFYIKDNQALAAASSQRDTETAAISELMRLNQMLTPKELREGPIDLVGQLRS